MPLRRKTLLRSLALLPLTSYIALFLWNARWLDRQRGSPPTGIHDEERWWKHFFTQGEAAESSPRPGMAARASPRKLDVWLARYNRDRNRTRERGFHRSYPMFPDGLRNAFHVVVPFYNVGGATLRAAFRSIAGQDYPPDRLWIWLADDKSDEAGTIAAMKEICGNRFTSSAEEYHREARDKDEEEGGTNNSGHVWCLRFLEHLGPGGNKYRAFQFVEKVAGANDVVLVLDGDDELHGHDALNFINAKYIDGGVWCTYGSFVGPYSTHTKPLPELANASDFSPRNEEPVRQWRYGHPRTFKAHLLEHVTERDFSSEDRSWLVKATDRGFVYRVLELSGPDRIGYVPKKIYRYKPSSNSSTLNTVPRKVREANLNHVLQLPKSSRLELPVHAVVVLSGEEGTGLLERQLESLRAQSILHGNGKQKKRRLYVHFLNNNPTKQQQVDAAVSSFQEKPLPGSIDSFMVSVAHVEENWGPCSRLRYVNELRRRVPLDAVIFLGGDHIWDPTFLASLADVHRPKSMTTWYGKNLRAAVAPDVADYWNATVSTRRIEGKASGEAKRFKVGGLGGSVVDANLWLFDEQLLRLHVDPRRFCEHDDIWISFVLDGMLGWEIRRLAGPRPMQVARSKSAAEELGMRVHDKVVTRDNSAAAEQDFFTLLQREYAWEVLEPP